jgi:hypothetical protein
MLQVRKMANYSASLSNGDDITSFMTILVAIMLNFIHICVKQIWQKGNVFKRYFSPYFLKKHKLLTYATLSSFVLCPPGLVLTTVNTKLRNYYHCIEWQEEGYKPYR